MARPGSSTQHPGRRAAKGVFGGVFGFLFLLLPGALEFVHAQGSSGAPVIITGAFRSRPVTAGVFDADVRRLPKAKVWKPRDPIRIIPRLRPPPAEGLSPEGRLPPPPPVLRDPLLQLQESAPFEITARVFSTPSLNFDGIAFTGAFPPDTVGDIGPNHYIQMVNDGTGSGSVFALYNKSGTLLAGPTSLQTLWTAGGACASGLGDPIVLYDRLADRWLMSEFASMGNHLCVYISRTADPVTGGWFLYDFTTPNFPDYPKYAVWPDAYYVSTNEATGPAVYALDRSRMLQGLSATFQRFTAPSLAGFGFQALTPSDLDGPIPPPAGSPNFFMRHRDDEVHNVGSNDPSRDFLELWEFHVDWATPANSTFTKVADVPVAEFDSDLCGLISFECFPQPSTTRTLDPLREVVMWRLQYRNFGPHETLVGNLVTDVDGTDHGGIRWFELRKTGGSPSLHQEGTYAPDAAHRWMGSIAMDEDGNIALGYSVSSSAVFPSIRYAGRLTSDPSGTLPQSEFTVIAGGGSQTATTRWGDYSSLNVDPSDDCTFWYTNEYIPASSTTWRTRVASFKFDSCGQTVIDATPSSHDFGNIDVGSSADATFTVQNAGAGTLTGLASASAPFSIISGSPFSLDSGASQGVVVRFSPTAGGSFAGSVIFSSNGGIVSRAVTGTGTDTGTFSLTVNRAGTGSGTVASSPDGINCGTDCSESYTSGTIVTLTPSADSGSVFAGWSGACDGMGSCMVTMNAARSVTATFDLAQNTSAATSARLMIGQMPISFALTSTVTARWFDFEARAGRSYCVEVTTAEEEDDRVDPVVTVFRSDGTTVIASNGDIGTEPDSLRGSRACFVWPAGIGNLGFVRATAVGSIPTGGQHAYHMRMIETTLFCNWFYRGGDYSGFIQIRNTTDSLVTTTVSWRDLGGVVRGSTTTTVPANGVLLRNARDFVPSSFTSGSVEIAHNGSPEALVGTGTTLSGTTGLSLDAICFQRRPW